MDGKRSTGKLKTVSSLGTGNGTIKIPKIIPIIPIGSGNRNVACTVNNQGITMKDHTRQTV